MIEKRARRFRQAVDAPVRIPGNLDKPVFAEVGEMPRRLHLGKAQDVLKMADAERAVQEQDHHPKAGLVSKAIVNPGQVAWVHFLRTYAEPNIQQQESSDF